ncbi:hypothetical protein [Enemella evansiae]|uniref:hypothetical protein n=1 Tax=Enemella evansiae TaxID=2016499 RepID=UPI000C01D150|nr:hypothetical protein [Enemella evansiae]NNG18471.1 hypothetical protein [Naumannella sp. ID2617S]PFG68028.1 hypothetical protein B0O41_2853 [Propionibacteriaceae bacterium ES.041]TDO86165.1 hypothetical protein C8D81_3539 [Enemella evansiae]
MWHWKSDGGEINQDFADQAAAEEWLTAHYEDLLDEGILCVTLCEGDREVYGPMSLEPA